MKTTRLTCLLSVLISLAWVAGPVASPVQAAGPGGPGVARASGSGHFRYLGELRTFSFTAQSDANGNVHGQAQLNSRGFPAKIHLALNCLVVQGTRAFVGGIVTASDDPQFPVGCSAAFGVIDNGESGSAFPDEVTALLVPWEQPCASFETQAMLEGALGFHAIERGNVRVR